MTKPPFEKEAELCAAFIAALPKEWTAYPETGGFDILLVRAADGFQIGVEAKLRLNAKVICQAAEYVGHYYVDSAGPDCRAVLIPEGVSVDLAALCPLIGVSVISMSPEEDLGYADLKRPPRFRPNLPRHDHEWDNSKWFELCPAKRIELPDYVPDVTAGDSAPVALTDWKIRAIKIAVTLERRGFVTRQDFAHFRISMSRWTQCEWLLKDGSGGWIAGPYLPDFHAQHPVNFPQIEADYEKWKNPSAERSPVQGALL
jgi:hypothetical protein